MRADRPDHRVGDLQHEAHAVLDCATVRVRPRVGGGLQELVQEVPVRRVDLYAVEPRFQHRVFGGDGVQPHVFLDLLHGQRARRLVALQRDGARPDDRKVARFPEEGAVCDAPGDPELEINERSVCVYCIRDLCSRRSVKKRRRKKNVRGTNRLPSCDLLIVPDTRNVGVSTGVQGDECSLGDGESAGNAGTLLVVFETERTEDVSIVGAGSPHGSQDDPMLQVGGANTDGLEYFWDRSGH